MSKETTAHKTPPKTPPQDPTKRPSLAAKKMAEPEPPLLTEPELEELCARLLQIRHEVKTLNAERAEVEVLLEDYYLETGRIDLHGLILVKESLLAPKLEGAKGQALVKCKQELMLAFPHYVATSLDLKAMDAAFKTDHSLQIALQERGLSIQRETGISFLDISDPMF